MSKAARLREKSVRERIAAQQAAARRKEQRRRVMLFGGTILAVIAVVVGIIVGYDLRSPSTSPAASGGVHGTVLPASTADEITDVPAATLNQIGRGSVLSYQAPNTTTGWSGYTGLPPIVKINNSLLTSGGKPEMLYIGAEFCPYCAATRWAMAVALSRFGHFTTPLRGFHSSSTDADPSTPTLTFYQAGYSSKYLTFTPVENEDVNRNELQPTTSAEQAVWVKYDTSTEDGVTSQSYPFIDFGNKALLKYPIYDPAIFKGLTWAQVASELHNPSTAVAQAADGAANYFTAAICHMTGNKGPAGVCTSSSIKKLEKSV
jgi:thiol-disulfide isomerase/thioredoxin